MSLFCQCILVIFLIIVVAIRSATSTVTTTKTKSNKVVTQERSSSLSSSCGLKCDINSQCYANATEIQSCLSFIPFNKTWAEATVNVISQSLDNYGFLALYHSTGPPYSLSIDIQAELSSLMTMINDNEFITDFEFQEYIQSLLQSTLDAHTRYQKPACYSATFIQPFAFDVRINGESSSSSSLSSSLSSSSSSLSSSSTTTTSNNAESSISKKKDVVDSVTSSSDTGSSDTGSSVNGDEMQLYIMKNKYTDIYSTIYPHIPIHSLINQQISLLNKLEFVTELSQWSDKYETKSNNRGIRFNAAIRSYLYRSVISLNVNNINDLIITLINGTSYTLPWMGSYSSQFADINTCVLTKTKTAKSNHMMVGSDSDINDGARSFGSSSSDNEHSQSIRDQYFQSHIYSEQSSSSPSSSTTTATTTESSEFITRSDRHIIIPSNNTYQLSCFIQSITPTINSTITNITNVLVMKVSSFSPPGNGYIDAWTHFLDNAKQCLTTDYHDMIIVDVMQNGGGYVCLGIRLIELLIEEYNLDHTKVQMKYDLPHSKLMDRYIKVVNAPDPYPNPQDVEQILDPSTQLPFEDGNAYYYPGRNVTQGGILHTRTNFFALDCREAEVMPLDYTPSSYMPPNKLIILTDGTCGSTCATFTKIPQEAGLATFIGVGGIWNEGMDVSSFAGGFVCNPDYLAYIANASGTTFPSFLTNQRWQFDWATWYSAKQPSRQTQFTVQEPTYRQAFWGFPHPSIDPTVTSLMISALYDEIIYTSINRVAADMIDNNNNDDDNGSHNNDDNSNSECSELNTLSMILIFVSSILLSILISMLIYLYIYTDVLRYRKYNVVGGDNNTTSSSSINIGTGNNREPLITDDMVDSHD